MKDWEIQFQFKVYGHGKELFGDGFTFWYAQERNILGIIFLLQFLLILVD